MLPQRNMQRLGLRLARQSRSTPVRTAVQRRFNSTQTKPDWLVDNAFNRERENVKHHAASTSSMFFPDWPPYLIKRFEECQWLTGFWD